MIAHPTEQGERLRRRLLYVNGVVAVAAAATLVLGPDAWWSWLWWVPWASMLMSLVIGVSQMVARRRRRHIKRVVDALMEQSEEQVVLMLAARTLGVDPSKVRIVEVRDGE